MRFVVDTSALVAIRAGEPERESFHRLLVEGEPVMSVASVAELTMVWQARFGATDLGHLDRLMALYRIRVEPVLADDATLLRDAVIAFGRGRAAAPAVLNFGDLFAYVLARRLGLPLLHKGADLAAIDVAAATV
jgi:ribonuclease VapC